MSRRSIFEYHFTYKTVSNCVKNTVQEINELNIPLQFGHMCLIVRQVPAASPPPHNATNTASRGPDSEDHSNATLP